MFLIATKYVAMLRRRTKQNHVSTWITWIKPFFPKDAIDRQNLKMDPNENTRACDNTKSVGALDLHRGTTRTLAGGPSGSYDHLEQAVDFLLVHGDARLYSIYLHRGLLQLRRRAIRGNRGRYRVYRTRAWRRSGVARFGLQSSSAARYANHVCVVNLDRERFLTDLQYTRLILIE